MKKEIYIFSLAFLLASFVFLLHFYIVKSAVWGDGQYYYSYLRSTVLDKDLDFRNELEHFKRSIEWTKIGTVANKYSVGPAILWTPFFLLAHLLTGGDGYSYFYQAFVGLGSVFYSILGLWLCFLTVKKYFDRKIALISTLGLWLSSNLFFYTSLDPINSHSLSFFVSSLVVYLLSSTPEEGLRPLPVCIYRREISRVIVLGVLTGCLALIRNQDIIFAIPIVFLLLFTPEEGLRPLPVCIYRLLIFIFFFFLTFLPQLFVWRYLYGQWANPYILRGEKFYWFAPKILSSLFSQNNGLLYYSPVLILTLVGLYYFFKKNKSLALVGAFLFIMQTYIISSWHDWHGGQAFGGRMFISLYPFFIMGLAEFLVKLRLKYSYKALYAFITLFTIINFTLIIQFLLSKP